MGTPTYKYCPKCGKNYFSETYICPNCNPKAALAVSALSAIGKIAKLISGK